MRNLVVNKKYDNKKLNVFLQDLFDGLSINTFYKSLRKKDIIVNGLRVKENIIIHTGDTIICYIADDHLFKQINYDIFYEDDNILIVNKPVGVEVVSQDESNKSLTSTLQKKLGYNIMPCHRLDRNTSGLVLFAKNTESLNILTEKFKNHEIEKFYKCTVLGIPAKSQDVLNAYLFKDRKKSIVYVYDSPRKGALKITTSYKVLETNKKNNTSILEVNLHTGRTHQIRAHLAHIGHPIIGDGKYGINEINKKFGKNTQELCAYKLVFNFTSDSGILKYLSNKSFILE